MSPHTPASHSAADNAPIVPAQLTSPLVWVGAALVAATWLYLVIARPTDWDSVGSSAPALITLGGYIAGAIVMLAAVLPKLPARTIAMIPAALVLNIVVGKLLDPSVYRCTFTR